MKHEEKIMNTYCQSALNQIKIAVMSIVKMIDKLEESDLQKRPTANKHSIGELLEHITLMCKADSLISDGASQEEMTTFYSSISYENLNDLQVGLHTNYQLLEEKFLKFTEYELQKKTTSFWGVTYTRFEWLLEIVAHIYHHRGQLHAMLVHYCEKDPKVPLFE